MATAWHLKVLLTNCINLSLSLFHSCQIAIKVGDLKMARDGVHKGLIFHLEDESLLQLEKQITVLEETEISKQVSFNIYLN